MHRSLRAWLVEQFFTVSGYRKSYAAITAQIAAGTYRYREEVCDVRRYLRDVRTERLCGRTVHVVNDKNDRQTTLIYLHGGGYAHAASRYHYIFLNKLIRATDYRVVIPLYGRVPLHTCREEIPILTEIFKQFSDGGRILVGGDSAGGGLAVALTYALHERALPLPAGLMLFSPWMDATASNPEIARYAPLDKMVDLSSTQPIAELWSDRNPADPLVSPILGDVGVLPPSILYTGTYESLYPDTVRFRTMLEQKHVPLIYREYEKMGHVFILWPIREADRAFRDLLQDLALSEGAEDRS